MGTTSLIKLWKFQNIPLKIVTVARAKTFLEAMPRDLTW